MELRELGKGNDGSNCGLVSKALPYTLERHTICAPFAKERKKYMSEFKAMWRELRKLENCDCSYTYPYTVDGHGVDIACRDMRSLAECAHLTDNAIELHSL